ncbi:MAG: tRNA uridine(34) 5-carboxymethylaminomethyl modification radical SAM/GNAT enzyme Elp3 [Promethearchaeota archaeon]
MNVNRNEIKDRNFELACRAIIEDLLSRKKTTKDNLVNIKAKYCRKFKLDTMPKNSQVLELTKPVERDILLPILKRRKTRTLSGVSVIAVMTKPLPCPGECIYCPGVHSQPGEPVAQSYTGKEPAALRSLMYNYDPVRQVSSRIRDIEAIGHSADKIELIIMGGTFLAATKEYQEYFVKGCFDGVIGRTTSNLDEAKRLAETSARRLIGVTFETRPDFCMETHIDAMLDYGGTRVEIGIQNIYDDIYRKIKRGHSTQESTNAIRIAKDAGLKTCLHLMPNLPGSTLDLDRKMFSTVFSDENYKPDYLKIYPCLVIGGTELESEWKAGKYKTYELNDLIDLLSDVKAEIPEWIRIQRIQRDIPAYLILDGVKKGNLRELVWKRLDETHRSCNCIRCREYGFSRMKRKKSNEFPAIGDLEIKENKYLASGGIEYFISAINKDTNEIFGYIRLRKPSKYAHRIEISSVPSSIIREIRVVGEIVPVSEGAGVNQAQHRGLGKILMERAENIAISELTSEKLLVIAGIGARPYFYKLGFSPDGPYVSKILE